MAQIEKVYQHYAEDLFREHPNQFQKAQEWMERFFHQPRLRF